MVKGVGRGGGESCNIKEKDFNNELSLNGSKYINQIDHVCHVFQVFCVVSCCFVLFPNMFVTLLAFHFLMGLLNTARNVL